MLLLPLALVTVTFSPAAPTVGDRITVEFAAPVTLEASDQVEIVERQGKRAVVRTFTPEPIVLRGTVGGVRFRNLRIPVRSVLKKNDDRKPAPLVPPKPLPVPRLPYVAMGLAAALAAALWTLVLRASRATVPAAAPLLPPGEVFRRAVLELRARHGLAQRWASLADATRRFLAATRPRMGTDLTTSELVPRLAGEEAVVVDILRQGDLEKFSAAGAPPLDFEATTARALDLVRPPEDGG